MKKHLISLALAALACSVRADQIKIKFNDLVELGAALKSLDGVEKEVKTSDQGTRVIRVPLDLKPAARIAIAKNLSSVRGALDAFESQRMAILQRVSPGAVEKVQKESELLAKFMQLWTDLVKEPVVVEITLLTEDQLNLEANKDVAGSVLAGLTPVLKK